MITLEEAKLRMERFLSKQEEKSMKFDISEQLPDITIGNREISGNDKEKVELIISQIEENEYAWRFYWNSKIFMETRNESYSLIGNTPLIIDKKTGDVYGTLIDYPKNYLEDFADYKQGNVCEYDWKNLIRE